MTPAVILRREGKTPEEQEANAKKITARLDALEAIIRRVAAETNCRVAENRTAMQTAIDAGKSIMSPDNVHPNYLGQSLMARAILDAMGLTTVKLPATFTPSLFPGIPAEWKMRPAPLDADKHPIHLTAETVTKLQPDASWITYTLPDAVPVEAASAEDWNEQLRRNGYALQTMTKVGSGLNFALVDIPATQAKSVFLQIGIGASTVWWNGVKVHDQSTNWTGFHIGKERIPVQLQAGNNRLVAEFAGQHFGISVTNELIWEKILAIGDGK